MKYKENILSLQYNELQEKLMCVSTSSDFKVIESADIELSLFEQTFLHEPMVFDEEHDELSILLPIIRDNFKESYDPAYFYFDNGNLRRPVISNDEEKELATNFLTPRMGGFTGRIGVHNWSSVEADKRIVDSVTVTIERSHKKKQ